MPSLPSDKACFPAHEASTPLSQVLVNLTATSCAYATHLMETQVQAIQRVPAGPTRHVAKHVVHRACGIAEYRSEEGVAGRRH